MECYFRSEFKPRYEKTGKKNLRCFPNCADTGHVTTGFCGQAIVCMMSFSLQHLAALASQYSKTELEDLKMTQFNAAGDDHEWLKKCSEWVEAIEIWGEITRKDDFNKAPTDSESKKSSHSSEVGKQSEEGSEMPTSLAADFFSKHERTKRNPTGKYLRGKIQQPAYKIANGMAHFIVAFNDKRISWHYSWHSSKTTCESMHCFKICVLNKLALEESMKGHSPRGVPKSKRKGQGNEKGEEGEMGYSMSLLSKFASPSFKLYSRHRVRKHRELIKSGINCQNLIPEYDKNFQVKVKQDAAVAQVIDSQFKAQQQMEAIKAMNGFPPRVGIPNGINGHHYPPVPLHQQMGARCLQDIRRMNNAGHLGFENGEFQSKKRRISTMSGLSAFSAIPTITNVHGMPEATFGGMNGAAANQIADKLSHLNGVRRLSAHLAHGNTSPGAKVYPMNEVGGLPGLQGISNIPTWPNFSRMSSTALNQVSQMNQLNQLNHAQNLNNTMSNGPNGQRNSILSSQSLKAELNSGSESKLASAGDNKINLLLHQMQNGFKDPEQGGYDKAHSRGREMEEKPFAELPLNIQLTFTRLVSFIMLFHEANPRSAPVDISRLTTADEEMLKNYAAFFLVGGVDAKHRTTSEIAASIANAKLRRFISQLGSDGLKRNTDNVFAVVKSLTVYLVMKSNVSEQISELFKNWNRDATQLTFSANSQVPQSLLKGSEPVAFSGAALERAASNMSPEELERVMFTETVKFNPRFQRSMSLMEEIIQLIFTDVNEYFSQHKIPFSFLEELMEIAVKTGVLPFDVTVPPDGNMIQFMCQKLEALDASLNGTSVKFDLQNGSIASVWSFFCSHLSKTLMKQAIVSRLQEKRNFGALPKNASPLPSAFEDLEYIQGVWDLNGDLDKQLTTMAAFDGNAKKFLFLGFDAVFGIEINSLKGSFFKEVFKKLKISICNEAVLIQGKEKFMTISSWLFKLDEEPKPFQLSTPFPLLHEAPNCTATAWFDRRLIPGKEPELAMTLAFESQQQESHKVYLFMDFRLSSDVSLLSIDLAVKAFNAAQLVGHRSPGITGLKALAKTTLQSSRGQVLRLYYKRGI